MSSVEYEFVNLIEYFPLVDLLYELVQRLYFLCVESAYNATIMVGLVHCINKWIIGYIV
jgi:hypothetical protein